MHDIRNIAGLWCDDITFCQEDCERMDCPRNKHNIRDRSIPHSFSLERPKDCPKDVPEIIIPQWIEADKLQSSTTFLCPHCREKVYFSHGSSSKSRKNGVTKRCMYRFCPWCGEEVTPLRINYLPEG